MMNDSAKAPPQDLWSDWLLGVRYARNVQFREKVDKAVQSIRDRVLDGARLGPGMRLVDIGTGDGLVALGAIGRIGPSLQVVMTDISVPLLQHTQALARELGVESQCRFLEGSADRIDGVADGWADVVTSRAVLAYVDDKAKALREFFRILRPGGRLSIAEPILQDQAFETGALTKLVQSQPTLPDIDFLRLLQRYRALQYPSTEEAIWKNPLTNYSERDLLRLVGAAGFIEVHLELHIDMHRGWITHWDVFLDTSPHPWAKPLRAILAESFSTNERLLFERIVRPQVESGSHISSDVIAYFTAAKPL